MLKFFKAKFAKDRWRISRIGWWGHDGSVSESRIQMVNRYSYKLRIVTRRGEWQLEDFIDGNYRG
jgi:hypothetical protein